MSPRPNLVPFRRRDDLDLLLADIREYAADRTIPHRLSLLRNAAMQMSRFTEELMNDADQTASVLETVRVLRNAAGAGRAGGEEEIMKQLQWVAMRCVSCLLNEGMTRETCRTAGCQSSDPDLQPLCAVVMLLKEFALECFTYSRPRETFAGQRRSLAFEILGTVGLLMDLPGSVDLAMQTIKQGRSDTLGAINFLSEYLGARKEMPDGDMKAALLSFAEGADSRGLAVAALNLLVELGSIGEMEALDRIDTWKEKQWSGMRPGV